MVEKTTRILNATCDRADQCETPICPEGAITAFLMGLPFMEMLDFGQSQVQPVEVQLNLDGLPQTPLFVRRSQSSTPVQVHVLVLPSLLQE